MTAPIDQTLLAQLETQASDKRYDYLVQQLIAAANCGSWLATAAVCC